MNYSQKFIIIIIIVCTRSIFTVCFGNHGQFLRGGTQKPKAKLSTGIWKYWSRHNWRQIVRKKVMGTV